MGCFVSVGGRGRSCFILGLLEYWLKVGRSVSSVNEALEECLCFLLDIRLVGA